MSYSIVCAPLSGDTGCYEGTTTTDANSHRTLSLSDALGHQTYTFTYTGTNPYTQYASTTLKYDAAGRKIEQDEPNGGKATWTYDAAGRLLGSTDPDQGSFTYNYDANGNQTYIRDNRGDSTGTVILCYDGLNRKSKLIINGNSCTTGTTLATWSYDSGSNGQGHLTGETWASNGATGSYAYVFDGRGQQTKWTSTFGSSSYPFSMGYNDAGMPSTVTYPDGTVLTASYTSQGWPSAATVNRSGTNTTLVSAIGYSGTGGAAMEPTSASIGNGTYSAAYSYDGLAHLTSMGITNTSTSANEFSQSRGYDSVGNVTSVNTTLPAGTDNQAFCYDEFNRLVWAGSAGTPSCGSSLTEGTLTSAAYTQSYAYDQNNRLTTGPAGTYTYGNSTFRDAVTSTSGGYGAAYDGAGDMTCRAPTSSQTYVGTQTK